MTQEEYNNLRPGDVVFYTKTRETKTVAFVFDGYVKWKDGGTTPRDPHLLSLDYVYIMRDRVRAIPEPKKDFVVPSDMDPQCVELCVKLNSLSGVETYESCCGHLKYPYMIFFRCNNFVRLAKLFRCVNKNYSDGKWVIEVDGTDVHPTYGFLLRSIDVFKSYEEMSESIHRLIENIDWWEDSRYDGYFEKQTNKEYIVAAAYKVKPEFICNRGNVWKLGTTERDDIYQCRIGRHHAEIIHNFSKEIDHDTDGFYTSYGRWVDRKEAARLALESGQITRLHYWNDELDSSDIF